ncbi:methyltransferase domain-containing protein [Clostridium sp. FP1]|uniref:methyltransferase domain-containing protein n=1 Tax=Clostridium sp. FP1 TaxID=2724076 RepID=UPI0013E91FE7|nr:methyltransferase domain-containing protein [Clostridium sp. FP1]MBZ9636014.1 methyltransferase domain-containing protein [Clostridium sp. FP1]
MKVGCIIQANRYGWDGTEDYCMKKIDNKYLIEHVVEKIKNNTNIDEIVIAVPNIENNYIFNEIAKQHGVKCYSGSIANVLERFTNAAKEMDCDIIVKTLGQNCFIDTELLNNMLDVMETNKDVDFLQTPDDFETKFTAEIFKSDLLININHHIQKEDNEKIKKNLARPMSFVKANKDKFNVVVYEDIPEYSKEYLISIREKSKQIYEEGETTGIDYENQVENGNFFLERYKFAIKHIKQQECVLDIACGSGYGTKYVYDEVTKNIIGADLSENAIKYNKKNYLNIDFQVQDATKTTFSKNQFDVVLSMETFEHIPLELIDDYLNEMKRVLKDDGVFICTTPQNGNGDIPLVPWHVKEYSLKEFKDILSKYFYLERIYGSKNGIYTNDEKGNGMMAICKKGSYK